MTCSIHQPCPVVLAYRFLRHADMAIHGRENGWKAWCRDVRAWEGNDRVQRIRRLQQLERHRMACDAYQATTNLIKGYNSEA